MAKKERHLLTDKIKNMCVQCKRYPHHRMILYISIITIVSGVLSISLFYSLPAVAALLTSICAGCITGIVFYILANMRNNEMNASREEWEFLNEHYQICQQTQKLCLTVVTNSDVSKENIAQICADTRKLFRFMACLCVDLPRAARITKDYPLDYLGHLEKADAANYRFRNNAGTERKNAEGHDGHSSIHFADRRNHNNSMAKANGKCRILRIF